MYMLYYVYMYVCMYTGWITYNTIPGLSYFVGSKLKINGWPTENN